MGADIIVVHTGSAAKIGRAEAVLLARDTLYKALEELGSVNVRIGLETMGKQNQLGTLTRSSISAKWIPAFARS